MAEFDELFRDSDDEYLSDREEEMFSYSVETDMHQGDLGNSNEVILLAMFDEHGQQLECPNLPLGPASSTEPAQENPPLASSPPFPRNVSPEVVVVVERLDGDEYLFADEHELFREEVLASSSGGAERGVRGVRVTAGRRRARGGRRARGARASVSSSWRRGDQLIQVCVTDDDVPEDLRDRILRLVANREARERRAERRRMEVDDNDDEADGIGRAALFEDATSLNFDWRPMDSFQGERDTFLAETTGPTTPSGSAYEAFRQYWDDSIMSHIATETNRYAVELSVSHQ